jgi:hypothetical protein
MADICPFCGHDPYHYVDIGVGYEAVAVTCCEHGVELFDHRSTGDVTMSREEFVEIANKLREQRAKADEASDLLEDLDSAVVALQGLLLHPDEEESWADAKAALPALLERLDAPVKGAPDHG